MLIQYDETTTNSHDGASCSSSCIKQYNCRDNSRFKCVYSRKNKMKLRDKIVLTTFGLFMIEAIMHYNQGKNDCAEKEQAKGWLPPTRSVIRLGVIVGVFSIINGVVIQAIEKK